MILKFLFDSLRPSDADMRQWIIGSDNGLSPGRRQAIIWTNAGIQWNLKRNSYIFIQENVFENVVWKTVAILYRPQCVKRMFCCISFTGPDCVHSIHCINIISQ